MTAYDRVIEAFGGLSPTAKALGYDRQRVWGWKKTGNIPDRNQSHILTRAKLLKKKLKPQDLVNYDPQ